MFTVFSIMAFAQSQATARWTEIISGQPETFRTRLLSSTESSVKVNVQVPGFYATTVTTPKGEANIISLPKSISTAQAGEPNLPMTGIPVMIGDHARMEIRVLNAQYRDFEDIEVAPSKGDFSRQIDPAKVPYSYGNCYNEDAFFPANNVDLHEPYIIRDFRGQNMVIYPFAYNPVSKTLRVFYDMTVEMFKVDDKGENAIQSRKSNEVKMDPDFKSMYQRHFINFEESMAKYTPVDEEGDLLIICYDSFISAMTDFVNWKKTRGINTTIVGTSTAGSTASAIKTYIQNQYNANNNLTHVLLVGDVAQIPGNQFSAYVSSSQDYSGYSDNIYGQIVGNDIYNDLFIGRFSASSTSQVATQVQKVITYERDLTTSATWCQNGLGISASAGDGGHNNEDDYQHIENLRTDLLNYGYSTVYQDYKSVSGYPSSTTTTISNHINDGVGIINYCNHGEETGWQSHYYMNSNVNALTNNNKLPFIFSVACLVGKYDYASGDCFAETWMHATNGSNSTGAIGGFFSYISQPWIPPMWAQDEFVDILVESYSSNIKHTLGGTGINGLFAIFDNYSTTSKPALGTYQAWVLYGDPSLMLRTKTPEAMTVNHVGAVMPGATSYTVNVSNGDGAVATITDASHNILGKATVINGTANVTLNSNNLTVGTDLTLCVFGYNKMTHLGSITVTGGTQHTITATANPTEAGTVTGAGYLYENTTCTLTAVPNSGYDFVDWNDGNIENPRSFIVTGDASFTANFTALTERHITMASVMNGSISADKTTAYKNDIVTLTATPATGFVLTDWVVYKTDDVNSTVTVSNNTFIMPDYDVTVSAVFLAPQGGDVTIGSGSSTSSYIPTYAYYNYSLSQQIYTFAEVGEAGTITAVAFKVANSKSTTRDIDLYLSHTSTSSFSSTSSWIAQSTSCRVFSGEVTLNASGWTTITLDTPFEFNGTSNLLLTVDDNTGSYVSGSSNSPTFYTFSASGSSAIYKYNDYTDYDPASMSTTGTLLQSKNQVMFTKVVPSTESYLSVSPDNLTGFTYPQGGGPSEAQGLSMIGVNLQGNLNVTMTTGYEVSSDGSAYTSTLSLTPSNGSLQQMLYVRLLNGLSQGNHGGTMTLTSGSTSIAVSLSGEVTENAAQTVTQTSTFTSGTNWWTPNIDLDGATLLSMLESALGSNGVKIIAQDGTFVVNSVNGWSGQLTSLEVGKMYMIQTNAACNISLEGNSVTLTGQTVTLNQGKNWIGYYGAQPIAVNAALAGLSATVGDVIVTQDGRSTTYSIYGWGGTLTTFEPGQAYIYYSKSTTVQTFTFPSSK